MRLVLNLRKDKLLNCLASAARAALRQEFSIGSLSDALEPKAAQPFFCNWLDSIKLGTECAKSACAAAGGICRNYYAATLTADLVRASQSLAVALELAVMLYISGTSEEPLASI